jgi:type III secretion YscU/HrpY family protein
MADKNDGGSKTEKPTPKRLKDARKKGDVARSKDLTSLAILSYWILFFFLFSAFVGEKLIHLLDFSLSLKPDNIDRLLQLAVIESSGLFIHLSIIMLVPLVIIATVVTFLQVGPVFTVEKFKPKMEHLNPVSGIKKMFSMDNLIELIKSVLKTLVLFILTWLMFRIHAADLIALFHGQVDNIIPAIWSTAFYLCIWATVLFCFFSGIDAVYQKHSFIKKMRMSLRDIKQEYKDNEGDPHLKGERRRQHKEFTENGARTATAGANVLLVNPTHVAVAIQYEKDVAPIPKVVAKGADELAAVMRDAAAEHKIPVLRNIQLARQLFYDLDEQQTIPKELFDVIAEVLVWAKAVKATLEQENANPPGQHGPVPGEDMTNYRYH